MQTTDIVILTLSAAFGFAFVILLARGGHGGFNLRDVRCPRCSEIQSGIRVPTSVRQALWGG